ncbi:MAG TPA: Glu-tRNA(Gln) amidotransferase subunit GatE [Candidatus Woesearchaeota archaeon]|nr:Glu-tRNA(Gln) amidotransferase subunit GatE [Candidatus Woesearchaeota archaeon]
MAALDYEAVGLKCGIEIHQQLAGKKLFCSCPAEIRKGSPDFRVIRRLRASAGEEGRVDRAALYEQEKQKYFLYHGYNDITCAVELDEEPPHRVNQEALRTALQVARMLNCVIVDEIQVMRKTVIDGSNTSGFQRTMLVGMNGFIEVNNRRIGIDTVCLEEEACQIIKRTKNYDIYNLSRLGIPLIEIATRPDIRTPQEAKDVAAKIGMILRSTGKCRRGIGSIRQDVNLSIRGGGRVEIKGFQELKSIPKIMEYEVKRQLKLIRQGKKPKDEVRKAEPDFTTSYLRPMPGSDRMYPETDVPPIIPDLSSVRKVKTIEERVKELVKKHGISPELAIQVVKQNIDLDKYTRKYKSLEPRFIADTLINAPKEIKARFGKEISVFECVDELFLRADKGSIPRSAVFEILVELAHGKKPDYEKYKVMSDDELKKEIRKLVKENPDAPINALMGMLMARFRGRVDGRKAMELLNKYKKKD